MGGEKGKERERDTRTLLGLPSEAGSPPRPPPAASPGQGFGGQNSAVSPPQRAVASSPTRAVGRSSLTGRLQVGKPCARGVVMGHPTCAPPPPRQAARDAVQTEGREIVLVQEAHPGIYGSKTLALFSS